MHIPYKLQHKVNQIQNYLESTCRKHLSEWELFLLLHESSDGTIRSMGNEKSEPQTDLYWIQCLHGKIPKDKGEFYKKFAPYASLISIDSEDSQHPIRMTLNDCQSYDVPIELSRARIRVRIGKQLQIDELIVQGLLWPAKCIVKIALSADWFFSAAYHRTEPNYYIEHILPYASPKTFRAIMSKLAKTLRTFEDKADYFYEMLSKFFDQRSALPLLLACSDATALEAIIKYEMPLPRNLMKKLCRTRPSIVVDYRFAIGQKQFEIWYGKLDSRNLWFTKKFVADHPLDYLCFFVEELDLTCRSETSNGPGKKQALIIFKKCKKYLLEKYIYIRKVFPFTKIWPKLSPQDRLDLMEASMGRFFFKKQLINVEIFKFLQLNGPDRLKLLDKIYEKKYGQSVFDNATYLDFIFPFLHGKELRYITFYFKKHLHDPNKPKPTPLRLTMYRIVHLLPKSYHEKFVYKLFIACCLHNDQDDIYEFFMYYSKELNYTNFNVMRWFNKLYYYMDVTTLNMTNLSLLLQIIDRLWEQNCRQFGQNTYLLNRYIKFLLASIEHVRGKLRDQSFEDALYNRLFIALVSHKIESWCLPSLPSNKAADMCHLKKLIKRFRNFFPANMDSWSKLDKRKQTIIMLFFSNVAKRVIEFRSKYGPASFTLSFVKPYDYILRSMVDDDNQRDVNSSLIKKLIPPKIYLEYELMSAQRLPSVDDLPGYRFGLLLKYELLTFKKNWKDYFEECRVVLGCRSQLFRGIKVKMVQFLKNIRWYQELPLHFVRECQDFLNMSGKVEILSYLVDGPTFEKIIKDYLRRNQKSLGDEGKMLIAIAESMPHVESPVSLPFAIEFFTLYTQRSNMQNVFVSLMHRWPMGELEFSLPLVVVSPDSVKMAFVTAAFKVMPERCAQALFESSMINAHTNCLRWCYFKSLMEYFCESRNMSAWKVIQACISYLEVQENEVNI